MLYQRDKVSGNFISFFLLALITISSTNGSALRNNFTQFGQRIREPRQIASASTHPSTSTVSRKLPSKQINETKSTAASYDSFRVLTPEEDPNGLLLVNSYHDFRRNSHHHGYYNGNGYTDRGGHHHYPIDGPGLYHHRHHHTHHYVGRDGEVTSDGEVVDPPVEEPVEDPVVDPAVDSVVDEPVEESPNGELVDPGTSNGGTDIPVNEEVTDGGEDTSEIEDVPPEEQPMDDPVSGDLRRPTDDQGTGPVLSDLPPTHFKCSHVKHPGHHADVEARCQVVLPGNRYGKWEILHFYHKSSPQKSNAVVYLDHGRNYRHHHRQPHYSNGHYNGHYYPHHYHHRHHSGYHDYHIGHRRYHHHPGRHYHHLYNDNSRDYYYRKKK
ncbi:uncharacterized protein LOC141852044 isoform X2 [Brevipalpus obovatus]|uniref:uncharacterized protein LOC141852044 isoform X2 n=1 Tax=Brevipalpus obovatus TaxID=246614 RepID=UPI003D9FAB9A